MDISLTGTSDDLHVVVGATEDEAAAVLEAIFQAAPDKRPGPGITVSTIVVQISESGTLDGEGRTPFWFRIGCLLIAIVTLALMALGVAQLADLLT